MAPLSAIADPRNLFQRILSGVVLAPLVLLLAFRGGTFFDLALATAAALGYGEWLRLVTDRPMLAAYAAPAVAMAAYWADGLPTAMGALAGVTALVWIAGRIQHAKNPVLASLGVPYVGLTMLSLSWLRTSMTAGWPLVLFVFLVIWASDIGGFVVGRAIGGPRLAPAISPNKTWAGFAGGVIFAAGGAMIWTTSVIHASRPAEAVIIAIALSLVGQGGDLFESAMKRRFRVKDSGELIPGHGGMLDRIDALLWAAPVFALFHAFGATTGLMP